MTLQKLVARVVETYGLLHQTNLRALRYYINTTPEDDVAEEIREITSGKELRTLWEAGLNTRLQEVVLEQLKEVK